MKKSTSLLSIFGATFAVAALAGYAYKQELAGLFQKVSHEVQRLSHKSEPTDSLKDRLPANVTLPYTLLENESIRAELILNGLIRPWAVEVVPGHGLLITEVPGQIQFFDWKTAELKRVGGVPSLVNNHRAHIFDIAIHPQFEKNHQIYVSYAVDNGQGTHSTEVAQANFDVDEAAVTDWSPIYQSKPPVYSNKHFGGGLLFKDGYIYLGIGDRFDRSLVQDPKTDIGKVIRILASGGASEVFSTGFRNPQNMALDGQGELWLVDHGPNAGDELNRIVPYANYGWPDYSSGSEYNGDPVVPRKIIEDRIPPVFTRNVSFAPSGVAFYSGEEFPEWHGDVFITTLVGSHLKQLTLGDPIEERMHLLDLKLRLRDLAIDPTSGLIYVLSEEGHLIRLSKPDAGQSAVPHTEESH